MEWMVLVCQTIISFYESGKINYWRFNYPNFINFDKFLLFFDIGFEPWLFESAIVMIFLRSPNY